MELTDTNEIEPDQIARKEIQRTGSGLSRKESTRRKPHKIERLQIHDLFEPDENDLSLIPKKHVLENLDFDQLSMSNVVTSELRDVGVDVESGARQSRSKSRKPPVTHSISPDQFLESVEVTLENHTKVRLCVPHVIIQCCEFIRKEISTEGIFRKSGSSSRVQSLKQRFSEKDSDVFNPDDTVIDAAVVLKTYLRELPAPLIPFDVHSILLKCFELTDERTRVEAILMCVYMLPLPNIHILIYLMEFLHEVVKHSHQNRMGYKNLALILTPNIMPTDDKKGVQKGKDSIIALEKNRKVIEIMILYGDYVGWVTVKLQKAIEVQLIYRNSDDELENDRNLGRDGRRKKRRSGSLTRVFGFLRKVTNSKGGDTPSSTVDTPSDFGMHTPVLKGSSKKRANDEPMFSTQKNPMRAEWKQPMPNMATPNIVRDKIRSKSTPDNARIPLSGSSKSSSTKHHKLGFGRKSGKKVDSGSDSETEMLAGFNRSDVENPTKNSLLQLPKYLKNFILLPSKNLKSSISSSPCPAASGCEDDNFVKLTRFTPKPSIRSCPLIPSTNNAVLHQQVQRNLQKTDLATSVVSIHNLQNSPRKKLSRGLSEDELMEPPRDPSVPRIPPPPEFSDPTPPGSICGASEENIANDSSGDGTYVTIAPTATVNDIPNEAFIASSCSLDVTDGDGTSSCENLCNQSGESTDGFADSVQQRKLMPVESLRLTPLIKEINNLTMFAQQEPVMPSKVMEKLDTESPEPLTEPLSFDSEIPGKSLETIHHPPPTASLAEVAQEFKRTLQEEKIIKLCQEMKGASPRIQRQGSMMEKGVSPSRRKINSFRRRRSHDSAKSTTPVAQSPRFMSLRSPRSRPVPPPISRSPTRCTLRRGRPNTAWTGLPRPSPARAGNQGSSRSPRVRVTTSGTNLRDRFILKENGNTVISPVMRRMSSVQELVHRLEKRAKMGKGLAMEDIGDEVGRDRRSLPSNSGTWHLLDGMAKCEPLETPQKVDATTTEANTPSQGSEWVAGEAFEFEEVGDGTPVQAPAGNRESIHFLKTRNAGKVSANVRMFDGMVKTIKSPTAGKSMIPRYTALHANRPQTKP